jgi:hypothetical protein
MNSVPANHYQSTIDYDALDGLPSPQTARRFLPTAFTNQAISFLFPRVHFRDEPDPPKICFLARSTNSISASEARST